MKFHNRNILIISPEPWHHIFVSKHHYATHLASCGNKVFFLNPPSSNDNCRATEFKNVYSVDYTGFLTGTRFLPNFLQKFIIKTKFNFLQKLCDAQFDIIWSFDNSVFFDFSALPKSIFKISHIVDLNQDFNTYKTASTADICLASTRYILNRIKNCNKNSFFIDHGYNNRIESNLQIDLPGVNNVKAFYAGNLDISYIDWLLLTKLIKANPMVDFIFVGKRDKEYPIFTNPNVYYLGVLAAKDLPSYYQKADILLLCYKAKEYKQQLANPHKMMEYLGSGKMIVATWTEEYQKLYENKLIYMSTSDEQYLDNFKEAIDNVLVSNNLLSVNRRKSYAIQNSYFNQIEKIERIIAKIS